MTRAQIRAIRTALSRAAAAAFELGHYAKSEGFVDEAMLFTVEAEQEQAVTVDFRWMGTAPKLMPATRPWVGNW